ncbi:hypothetical protein HY945_04860 [Candidatus Gottesmanbacteria bacterium]|nr:hypothetical protein [Candidatus Gottesmanbacteria bacterium]
MSVNLSNYDACKVLTGGESLGKICLPFGVKLQRLNGKNTTHKTKRNFTVFLVQ